MQWDGRDHLGCLGWGTAEIKQPCIGSIAIKYLFFYLVKMIDFITDQSANYYHAIEDYQLQVDRLQNIIHDLNNKNNII